MKKATPKKSVGRPRTGRTPAIAITLHKELLDTIDKIVLEKRSNRSAVIREILADWFQRRNKKP